MLPITCLVIGDAVMGAEVRSATFAFTWMSPVPTWQIALGRWIGGTLVAAGTVAVAFALAAVVAGAPELAGATAVSGAFGAGAYVAVFIAIGCITKRAAVWSLAFVVMVEQLLGRALTGIAQLTPRGMARAAFVGLTDVRDDLGAERDAPRHRGAGPPRRHHHRRPGCWPTGDSAPSASPAAPTSDPGDWCSAGGCVRNRAGPGRKAATPPTS